MVTVYNRIDYKLQARIFDQFGRLLHKTALESGTNVLSLGSSSGLYVIQIMDNSGKLVENRRVILN